MHLATYRYIFASHNQFVHKPLTACYWDERWWKNLIGRSRSSACIDLQKKGSASTAYNSLEIAQSCSARVGEVEFLTAMMSK